MCCVYIYIYRALYVFKAHRPLGHIVYQQHLVLHAHEIIQSDLCLLSYWINC